MRTAKSTGRLSIPVAFCLVLIAVTGCVSPSMVTTEVTRFHRMDAAERPSTFRIEAAEGTDGHTLAFETYSDIVAGYLSANGFRRSDVDAEFVVELGYSIDDGREVVETVPGYYAGHSRLVHYVDGSGRGIVTGVIPDWHYFPGRTYSYTVYRRELALSIRPGGKDDANASSRPVFEATAVSNGGSGHLNVVMPQMVRAVFQAFPGRSGETYEVSLPLTPAPKEEVRP